MITYYAEYTESGTRETVRKGPFNTREEAESAPYGGAYGPIADSIRLYYSEEKPQGR